MRSVVIEVIAWEGSSRKAVEVQWLTAIMSKNIYRCSLLPDPPRLRRSFEWRNLSVGDMQRCEEKSKSTLSG